MRRGFSFLAAISIALLGAAIVAPNDDAGSRVEAASIPSPTTVTNESETPITRADMSADAFYKDHRAWQHGINLLDVNGRRLLVWSSWGATPTPTPNPDGNWSHDVYYSWIDPAHPVIDPSTLVTGPEAQEPASAAVSSRGKILMSCEDGNPQICQRAGLWGPDLKPVTDYGVMIRNGGHSGHVAAMKDRFVVAYAEEWIEDGAGVDGLGTGDDVWARLVNDDGTLSPEIPVSVSKAPDRRDWWPMVASSGEEALEIWQRFPSQTLLGSFVLPNATHTPEFQIVDGIKWYYYNVSWLPTLKLYAVFGSRSDGGFVSLIDRQGRVVATKTGLPETVRESKLLSRRAGRGRVAAIYPTLPSGAAVLRLTKSSIDLVKTVPDSYEWDYMGTDGMFTGSHRALFATLSKSGVRLVNIDF